MWRLLVFFLIVFLVLNLLATLPIVGKPFRIPFFGWWLAAIVVSLTLSKLANDAVVRARMRSKERALLAVDTPHNQGKLGVLYASRGRHRRALPHLERAVAGEDDLAEWHYRLGVSRLALGELDGARAELERTLALREDHAYGEAMLRLAEAETRAGAAEQALATLERYERARGPTPESAYRRGRALRALRRRDEARAAFAEVGRLARRLAPYQRRAGMRWVLRAALARLA